jgi:hypothetical protein
MKINKYFHSEGCLCHIGDGETRFNDGQSRIIFTRFGLKAGRMKRFWLSWLIDSGNKKLCGSSVRNYRNCRVETNMHFSIFTKMQKSCTKGCNISQDFVSETILFSQNFQKKILRFSRKSSRKLKISRKV